MWIHASSWRAHAASTHVNRMNFDGILTRVGVPSDDPPNGSGGKRVVLTAGAAQRALPSLRGMGVNAAQSLSGHDVAAKIGVIEEAQLEGDAIRIRGTIWACDFPDQAARVALQQADLGFSFEAHKIAVEDVNADPLVIVDCVFTGAAVLLKNQAAYRNTLLSVIAAREREHLPVSEGLKLAASAASGRDGIPVPRPLLRLMASRGIERTNDLDRLDEAQLAKLLENRTPSERIAVKEMVLQAGIYPRTLTIGTSIGWPTIR